MRAVSVSVDPRMARSRKAMLAAARDLLVREGPGAVTHQRVARQAGVGRATVYRHWPRVDQLLLDAMAQVDFPFFREPAAPVRPWLRRELRVLADEMALPPVAAIALAMMQSSARSQPAEVRDRFAVTGTAGIRAALALAAADGELAAAADPHDAPALLIGPILQRTCMEGGTVSDDLIDRIIDSLGTWHPRPDQPSARSGLPGRLRVAPVRPGQRPPAVGENGVGVEVRAGLRRDRARRVEQGDREVGQDQRERRQRHDRVDACLAVALPAGQAAVQEPDG
jgi:AcrR family transcriptional regulator